MLRRFDKRGSLAWLEESLSLLAQGAQECRIAKIGMAIEMRHRIGRLPGLNGQVLLFLCHSLLFHIGLLGIADILLNFYLVSIGYDTGDD